MVTAELQNYQGTYVICNRVSYGSKDTPLNEREYCSGNSPVGTKSDWLDVVKKSGKYVEVRFEDTPGNETLVFHQKLGYYVKIFHDTKDIEKGSIRAKYRIS